MVIGSFSEKQIKQLQRESKMYFWARASDCFVFVLTASKFHQVTKMCNFAKTTLDSVVFSELPSNVTSDDMLSHVIIRLLAVNMG